MQWLKYNINNFTDDLYEMYFNLLSSERKNYVLSLKTDSARKRTVAAEMLIKTALKDDKAIIIKDTAGKPYIKNKNVHISISHSEDYAVCALSDKPIGIDIEKKRDININTARKFCNSQELQYIVGDNSISLFFEIWTAKEAAYKLSGGELKSFKSIDTFKLCKQYYYFDDYIVCIVTNGG